VQTSALVSILSVPLKLGESAATYGKSLTPMDVSTTASEPADL
jgi:hypothetical protein